MLCIRYQGVKASDVTNVTWIRLLRSMFIRRGNRSFFILVRNLLEEGIKKGLDALQSDV